MEKSRKQFTKAQRKEIWLHYVQVKLPKICSENELSGLNLREKALCPICKKIILKAQYQGFQPNSWAAWDIDHIDSNPINNSLKNLQPAHPWCNKIKN